jgi:hypothetical protein
MSNIDPLNNNPKVFNNNQVSDNKELNSQKKAAAIILLKTEYSNLTQAMNKMQGNLDKHIKELKESEDPYNQ